MCTLLEEVWQRKNVHAAISLKFAYRGFGEAIASENLTIHVSFISQFAALS